MRSKLILAGLAATIVMAFATASASARNLSLSHGRLFNAIWSSLRFVSGGATAADCAVTLEGSFHYTTIAKVAHTLIGHITRARVGACASGSATVLTGRLPWHITYEGFEGALPDITGVRLLLIGAEFRIHERIFGTECLTATTTTERAVGVARLSAGSENRTVTGLTADPTPRIRCGILNGAFEGTAGFRNYQATLENLLVRLI